MTFKPRFKVKQRVDTGEDGCGTVVEIVQWCKCGTLPRYVPGGFNYRIYLQNRPFSRFTPKANDPRDCWFQERDLQPLNALELLAEL
jgi:hypothetical protein